LPRRIHRSNRLLLLLLGLCDHHLRLGDLTLRHRNRRLCLRSCHIRSRAGL
jgi:hypothetical protein